MRSQPQPPGVAVARLSVLFALLVVGSMFACRPTWSKDGSKLMYPAKHGQRTALAEYDVKSGGCRFVRELVAADGLGLPLYDDKHDRWVLVEAHASEDNTLLVKVLDANGEVAKEHSVDVGTRSFGPLMRVPVVLGGKLYLSGGKTVRIDLDSGDTLTAKRPNVRQQAPVPFLRGKELNYMSTGFPGEEWVIGKLDPETLEVEPTITRPEGCLWDIMSNPRFSPRGDRCAVAVSHGDGDDRENAILVFSDGKIESTIAVGKNVSIGPLEWGRNGVHLYATVVRIGEKVDTFVMFESDFSGAVVRETVLVEHPVDEKQKSRNDRSLNVVMASAMQPSVSPDGFTVAFTTALLPNLTPEQHGLLLIDVKTGKRNVKRVPFPKKQ